jgi:hypothetical protein
MAQTQNQGPAGQAGGAAATGLATEQVARGRIVFLNALPLNALPRRHIQLDVIPVALQELTGWVQRRLQEGYEVIHFIRHSATVQALRSIGIPLSEPNVGLYAYSHGDLLVIVTLRSPVRGQEATQLSPQDLEAWLISVV